MTAGERLRVVVAGPQGQDDPRAVALARALRDTGAEVVLTGEVTSAGRLAATVVQEDADAVGVAGAPPRLLGELLDRLSAAGVDDVTAFVLGDGDDDRGGDLPPAVRRFPGGTPPDDVVAALRRLSGGL
ncbi:cobalamin B12-binding domain-containing protein [Geodermatophilus sp. SYSU D01180]